MRAVGRLHVITDETLQSRFSHAQLAALAAQGGADCVQYREKRPLDFERRLAAAVAVGRSVAQRGARLVIDDDVELALASGASAVHLGRDDPTPRAARHRLGADAVIGATANSLDEARAVALQPVDYLGVGPVFGTSSKREPAPPLGLETLARIVAAVRQPVIAIGALRPERVEAVMATGCHGFAVLSAVVADADPAAATARFRDALERCVPHGENCAGG